jgi:hypothetical protein
MPVELSVVDGVLCLGKTPPQLNLLLVTGSKITSPVLDWVVVDSAARSDSRDF